MAFSPSRLPGFQPALDMSTTLYIREDHESSQLILIMAETPRVVYVPAAGAYCHFLCRHRHPYYPRRRGQRASTVVVSPPRGVNSPRTVHHTGFVAATMSRSIRLTAFS